MSHFTVTVCLSAEKIISEGAPFVGDYDRRVQAALEAVLAPFDENRDMEPYRKYEEGAPSDCLAISAALRDAEHHRNGTGVKPYDPDRFGWSSESSKKTPEDQRADFAKAAEQVATFPDVLTWEFAAQFSNERWGYSEREDDGELNTEYLHVDEDGRAYHWSRYNPDSKWDYWRIGGRWRNHFRSTVRVETGKHWEDGKLLLRGSRDWDSPESGDMTSDGFIRCDGGPVELLDFAGMRDEAEAEANKEYSKWESLVEAYGHPAESWERLCSLAELKEITWDQARQRYNSQEVVKAAKETKLVDDWDGPTVEQEFGTTREEYVRIKRAAAVPGYAMITLTGEWVAPGRMGWFGMSSDGPGEADAYKIQASKYLDELPRDAWVIQLDCHI